MKFLRNPFHFNTWLLIAKKIFFLLSITLLYCVPFQLFYNLLKYDTAIPYETWASFFQSTVYNFVPILVIALLNYFTIFYGFRKKNFTKNFALKLVLDFLISFCILVIVNWLFLFFGKMIIPEIKVDFVGTVLNNVLIFFGIETIYYITSTKRFLQKIAFEKRKVLQYQYDALKAQINPHFLFNSLNILYALVSIDVEKSKEFILALSSMYRYIMEKQNKRTIKLKEEFEFLDAYVSVLEMRFHNQFSVEFTGRELVKNEKIIPYTLQLLIENVTKHNIISTLYPMIISISVEKEFVSVSNPIHKKESESSSGIGLHYISEQYKIYGADFLIEDNGSVFIAKIPYI